MAALTKLAAESAVALAPGRVFAGAYVVVRCLQAGGMGAVYEVVQKSTERRRALKVMLPSIVSDPDLRARFKQEATVAAAIESDHIVETLDAGVDAETGLPFIVMELLKGEELRSLLERSGEVAPEDALTIVHQVALALDRTHAAGVIHRDLKPANLFLTPRDDGSLRVKVLDFGVAKIVEHNAVASDATRSVGSPLYMSPEQIRGDKDIGPRADLYALGHLAFTLLTGHAYFLEERHETAGIYPFLLRVMKGQSETASARAKTRGVTIPEPFNVWFSKATALDPAARFGSGASLALALAEALGLPAPAIERRSSLQIVIDSPASEAPLPHAGPAADSTEAPTTLLTEIAIPGDAAETRVDTPEALRRKRRSPLWMGIAAAAVAIAIAIVASGPSTSAESEAKTQAAPKAPAAPPAMAAPPALLPPEPSVSASASPAEAPAKKPPETAQKPAETAKAPLPAAPVMPPGPTSKPSKPAAAAPVDPLNEY